MIKGGIRDTRSRTTGKRVKDTKRGFILIDQNYSNYRMWSLVAADARRADFQFKAPCFKLFPPRTVATSRHTSRAIATFRSYLGREGVQSTDDHSPNNN